jgi:hypothetical protein
MPGEGSKRTNIDYANTAVGVASLIKGITTKKPKGYQPSPFTANIRPAQGNEEALRRIKNDIAEQTTSATSDINRMAGSDINQGIAGRVRLHANSSKAISDAEAENAKSYQEDLNRISQELHNQNLVNTQINNQANQYNSQVEQTNYAATKAASAAGVQSSLQYEANRQGDLRNKQVAETQANQMLDAMDKTYWFDTYNKAITQGLKEEEARFRADEAVKSRNFANLKTNFYQGKTTFFGRRRSTNTQ